MVSWTDPREQEGPDPMREGDVDDPDEVDVEENVEEAAREEDAAP
jgi:hypothetical protein